MKSYNIFKRLFMPLIIGVIVFATITSFGSNNLLLTPAKAQIGFWNGDWVAKTSPTCNSLNAIKGKAWNDIYAAGDGATVLHYDGSTWATIDVSGLGIPADTSFKSISWNYSADEVMVVGDKATIKKSGSGTWSVDSGAPANLLSAAFVPSNNVFKPNYSIWLVGGTPRTYISWNAALFFKYGGFSWNQSIDLPSIQDLTETESGDTINALDSSPNIVSWSPGGVMAAGGSSSSAAFYYPKNYINNGVSDYKWSIIFRQANQPAIKALNFLPAADASWVNGGIAAVGGNNSSFQLYYSSNTQNASNYSMVFSSTDNNLVNPLSLAAPTNANGFTHETWVGNGNGYITLLQSASANFTSITASPAYTPPDSRRWQGMWAEPNSNPSSPSSNVWAIGSSGRIAHYEVGTPQPQTEKNCSQAPTVTLSASSPINLGSSTQLHWTTTNATSVLITRSPDPATVCTNCSPVGDGTVNDTPPNATTYTYTATATNSANQTATAQATVVVNAVAVNGRKAMVEIDWKDGGITKSVKYYTVIRDLTP